MASTDARPIPIKNTAFRAVFPILDADGDLVTGATGLDSEVSKDQGTFADCTNEATEIATSSGMYYLDLTSTEMNADCTAVIVKTSSSGAKTTVLVFYPEETGDINVDVTAFGGTAGTFASGRPEVNTTHAAGTAWGSGAITAASIAADAITAAKIADGAIDAATFAASAITSTVLAADAITAAKVAADVTTELQAGLATAASITTLSGKVDVIDDFVDTEVAAILAAVDTEVAAIKAVTDNLPNGGALTNLDAAISTRATPAQVNTEVVDALATDTYAEPGQGAPSAATTLAAKINYLYKSWRNKKTNDGTDTKLFADDGVTVDQKQATSESAGTVTKAEWITGA